jgi:hypothetical protein
MPMKKRFTLTENLKHRVKNRPKFENPSEGTIDLIKQFARVYSVEKCKNGSFVEFVLN